MNPALQLGIRPRKTSSRLRVLYIAGAGRSGSTVIDRVLGSLPGAQSYNQLDALWTHGVSRNQLCTCGRRFATCPFWKEVLRQAFGGKVGLNIDRALDLQRTVARTRHFHKLYQNRGGTEFQQKRSEYQQILNSLYTAIGIASGNSVIVDSSKGPSIPLLLEECQNISVTVIHLIRDVRECVYSWRKQKRDPGRGAAMDRQPALATVFHWCCRNLCCELLGRKLPYRRVRYEDLMADPKKQLQELVDSLPDFNGSQLRFEDATTIRLPELHAIAGNPQRFEKGRIQLVARHESRERLDPFTRFCVTITAAPLLRRYGYI